MEVAPVSVRVRAKMTFEATSRIVFIGFMSPVTAVALMSPVPPQRAVRLISNSDLRPLSARDYSR